MPRRKKMKTLGFMEPIMMKRREKSGKRKKK